MTKISTVEESQNEFNEKRYTFLNFIGIFSSLSALCCSGAIFPSALNFIYFAAFIIFTTYMSCNRTLFKKFAVTLKIISILIAIHLTALIVYQNPRIYLLMENFQSYKFILTMFGFKRILLIDNGKYFSDFELNIKIKIDTILHPAVLVVTYFILTLNANYILVSNFLEICHNGHKIFSKIIFLLKIIKNL